MSHLMNKPTVCAVMLTADRAKLAARAVECFRAQTYQNKRLLVLDTGKSRQDAHVYTGSHGTPANERLLWNHMSKDTIGALRNIGARQTDGDIICAWDDDDFSHPDRIAEQVDLLKASGADLVAYNEMLFWRTDSKCQIAGTNEAWIYTGGPIGTSFCYWRKAWEKHPFEPTSYGEDNKFWRAIQTGGGKVTSVSALDAKAPPMMIARIHGSNTGNYDPQAMKDAPHHWRRAPEHDAYCRKVMG